jgi:hypothetical protein
MDPDGESQSLIESQQLEPEGSGFVRTARSLKSLLKFQVQSKADLTQMILVYSSAAPI